MLFKLLTAMRIDEVQHNAAGHDGSFDDGPMKFSNIVLRSSRANMMSKMKQHGVHNSNSPFRFDSTNSDPRC